MAKIRIKGLPELTRKLKAFEQQKWRVVMAVVDKYVDLMVQDAKSNAPKDLGILQNSIGKERKDNYSIIFYAGTVYAAMQEFGTGVYMDIPPELERDAIVFKGYKSGNFDEFLEEIKDWCGRKGIDQEAAYPIAVTILNTGLRPQPFFYPAFEKYRGMLIEEANRELNNLLQKL